MLREWYEVAQFRQRSYLHIRNGDSSGNDGESGNTGKVLV
jgi:hypothetical protein